VIVGGSCKWAEIVLERVSSEHLSFEVSFVAAPSTIKNGFGPKAPQLCQIDRFHFAFKFI
jgi:hypothetical protein